MTSFLNPITKQTALISIHQNGATCCDILVCMEMHMNSAPVNLLKNIMIYDPHKTIKAILQDTSISLNDAEGHNTCPAKTNIL